MAWSKGEPIAGSMVIEDSTRDDYTQIKFSPDLEKFNKSGARKDIVNLYKKRAYDIAGTETGLDIYFNGKLLEISDFHEYCKMYSPDIIYHKPTNKEARGRWEVAFAINRNGDNERVGVLKFFLK